MIINEGKFFDKFKNKNNKSTINNNNNNDVKKSPVYGFMSKEDFDKNISTISNIAHEFSSIAKKYNYEVECDFYGDDISIDQTIQIIKKDFNSGEVAEVFIDLVMNSDKDISENDQKKFIKDVNSLAKKYGFDLDFAKMNNKVNSSKYPDLFIGAYCDNWKNPYFQIFTKEENYKKSESTNESTSYLSRLVFESSIV